MTEESKLKNLPDAQRSMVQTILEGKYGIPPKEVENLRSRYTKHHLKEGFGSFDAFLRFASERGYKPGLRLRRYDERVPHGPNNSFFFDKNAKEQLPLKEPEPKVSDIVSPYCVGCKQKCPERSAGCVGWQLYFVRHWNQEICSRSKEAPPPEPPKREFFQYEHPDTIRRMLAQAREREQK